ncbi:PEGA domain protein [compost metagenome]
MSFHRVSRLPAFALLAALTVASCQAPGTPTTPTAAGAPAKGQGTIKGVVTAAGVQANAYGVLQAGAGTRGTVTVSGPGFSGEVPTDAAGAFSVNVPGGADYVLTATTSDGKGGMLRSTAMVNVPLAEDPPIVDVASLVTRRTGSIQGMITLPDGADPEGADVFVPGTTMVGKASAKGRFALANVPEGTWNISIAKPGYKTVALEGLTVKAGQPLVVTEPVTLEKGGATAGEGLKGLVRDGSGRAVVGATVTVYTKDNSGASLSAVSDDQGAFHVVGLPAGSYQVQVYRPFYNVPPRQDVTIEAGKGVDLGTIQLSSTTVYFGKVSGEVVDEAGEPVDGAVVMLNPPVAEQVFTDAQGRFTVDRIMPGDYTLSVAAGGYSVLNRDLLIDNTPNFTATLDETLLLRATIDPAKVKTAQAPGKAAPILLAPECILDGPDKRKVIWAPVAPPAGVPQLVYDLEIEDPLNPGQYKKYLTTQNREADLPANTPSMRIRSRDKADAYDAPPASFRLLDFKVGVKVFASKWNGQTITVMVRSADGTVTPVVTSYVRP